MKEEFVDLSEVVLSPEGSYPEADTRAEALLLSAAESDVRRARNKKKQIMMMVQEVVQEIYEVNKSIDSANEMFLAAAHLAGKEKALKVEQVAVDDILFVKGNSNEDRRTEHPEPGLAKETRS